MKSTKARIHLRDPYLFSLSMFAITMITCATYAGCFFFKHTYVEEDYLLICFIWGGLYVVCCSGFIIGGYLFLGIFQITATHIVLFAPFRRPICLQYEEITDIGIDFAVVNGSRQFWIYLSKDKLPVKFIHKLNHMPINKDQVKIQYTLRVCNELLKVLPPKLGKRLENSKAILQ